MVVVVLASQVMDVPGADQRPAPLKFSNSSSRPERAARSGQACPEPAEGSPFPGKVVTSTGARSAQRTSLSCARRRFAYPGKVVISTGARSAQWRDPRICTGPQTSNAHLRPFWPNRPQHPGLILHRKLHHPRARLQHHHLLSRNQRQHRVRRSLRILQEVAIQKQRTFHSVVSARSSLLRRPVQLSASLISFAPRSPANPAPSFLMSCVYPPMRFGNAKPSYKPPPLWFLPGAGEVQGWGMRL